MKYLSSDKIRLCIDTAIGFGTGQAYFMPGQVIQSDYLALELEYRGQGYALGWIFDANETVDIMTISQVS